MGAEAAHTLAQSPHLQQLTHLDLGNNRIGDEGARALAEAPHLGQLVQLDLRNNILGEDARAMLRARFGERVTL
jgi:hypothetical protein